MTAGVAAAGLGMAIHGTAGFTFTQPPPHACNGLRCGGLTRMPTWKPKNISGVDP